MDNLCWNSLCYIIVCCGLASVYMGNKGNHSDTGLDDITDYVAKPLQYTALRNLANEAYFLFYNLILTILIVFCYQKFKPRKTFWEKISKYSITYSFCL